MIRYVLDNDDDGHWYLVPCEMQQQFSQYIYGESEMNFPEGVVSLGSHPNSVTFEKPEHFGKVIE